ncbi:unnamed protein product [Rodentolepis nana]|uniref:Lipoprotein n=1 Tax=Rodentolepis nana TaxID=102285 RepID=A0A0R3TKI9_RODNA|nr:unnamed protein product [Rodentolepis nana]
MRKMISICLALFFLHFANGCVSQPRRFNIVVDASAITTSTQSKKLGTYGNMVYVVPSRFGWEAGQTLQVMRELCLRRYRRIPRTYEASGNLMNCTFKLKSGLPSSKKFEILLEAMNDYLDGAIFAVRATCNYCSMVSAAVIKEGSRQSMDVIGRAFITKMVERDNIELKCNFIIQKPFNEF